jgi:tetratricopeptide (TPR) repeat protein
MRVLITANMLIVATAMLLQPPEARSQAGLIEFRACIQDVDMAGDFMSLIFACTKVLSDSAQPPEIRSLAYRQRGYAHLLNGPPSYRDRVIADYNEAIKLHPTKASLYYDRAIAQSGWYHGNFPGLQECPLMLPDLDKAIELDGGQADFYSARADVYSTIGSHGGDMLDFERAIADHTEAVRLTKNKDDAALLKVNFSIHYFRRAEIFEKRGEVNAAIADYRKALEYYPGLPKAKAALERLGSR